MRVSFTGTRDGYNDHQAAGLRKWLREHRNRIVVAAHGCCSGADIQFHHLIREICGKSVFIAVYPSTAKTAAPIPEDADYVADRLPPLERNPLIIRTGPDVLLATPKEMAEVVRSGTWHAIRFANKAGVRTEIFWPEVKSDSKI